MTRPAIHGGSPVRDSYLGYGSQTIEERDTAAVLEALEGDYITRGPLVEEFEARVAAYVGTDHAIVVSSGTAALHVAGMAADFGPGDDVVTTPLTFASTAHTATYNGATPVFADVNPDTRNLDPVAAEERMTDETAGLVPVHYAGQPADIDALLDVADDHDLTVIWDASHAFGSEWNGEQIGGQRDMATFSFHPVKNITTAEGGMIVTDDDELAARARSIRSFQMDYDPEGHEDEPWYQVVEGLGYNYNVTELQAALGLEQLERVGTFKRRRAEIVSRYDEAFEGIPGIDTPSVTSDVDPFWHLYTVEVGDDFGCDRKTFVNAMHAENVGVQVHYVPLHYHPFFQAEYGYAEGEFPNAERVYDRIVSLPLFPSMADEDVADVIRAVERLHSFFE